MRNLINFKVIWLTISLIVFTILTSVASAAEKIESGNYVIEQPSFSGGAGSTSSDNYTARGVIAEQATLSINSNNFGLTAGDPAARQADVIPKPSLVNNHDYVDRLKLTINPQHNPTDTKYVVVLSSDNFKTLKYVQNDLTIGNTLGNEDFITYHNLGETAGALITGLTENTTYQAQVAATHGSFSATRYSAISDSAATVSSYLRFGADQNNCSLGQLNINQTKSCSYNLTLATNLNAGLRLTTLGSSLKFGSHNIQAIGETAYPAHPGSEQFGFNLRANQIPAVGQDPTSSLITITNALNQPDHFSFVADTEQNIAQSSDQTNVTVTPTWIANIATNTEPGSYTTIITHTLYAN